MASPRAGCGGLDKLDQRWAASSAGGGGFETVAARPPQPPQGQRWSAPSAGWGGFETVAARPPQPPQGQRWSAPSAGGEGFETVAARPPQPPQGQRWSAPSAGGGGFETVAARPPQPPQDRSQPTGGNPMASPSLGGSDTRLSGCCRQPRAQLGSSGLSAHRETAGSYRLTLVETSSVTVPELIPPWASCGRSPTPSANQILAVTVCSTGPPRPCGGDVDLDVHPYGVLELPGLDRLALGVRRLAALAGLGVRRITVAVVAASPGRGAGDDGDDHEQDGPTATTRVRQQREVQVRSSGLEPTAPVRVSELIPAAAGFGFSVWSGREDLNLDLFPGREACCNYTTSAKPASDEADALKYEPPSRPPRRGAAGAGVAGRVLQAAQISC